MTMLLVDLISHVVGFDELSPREKILLFAWHLHTHRDIEVFGNAMMRACFQELDLVPPDTSIYLPRMAKKKSGEPPSLIEYKGGYKLEGTARRFLDAKYGEHPSAINVARLLADLPLRVPNLIEREFLVEALNCYRVKAFRAAVVMVWNLAFDHLLRWLVSDSARLNTFNAAIPKRYPKKNGLLIGTISEFEDLKESEAVEILSTAGLVSKNIVEILRDKLKRRNIAAHPSQVTITQAQADDTITDLVNNVIISLI